MSSSTSSTPITPPRTMSRSVPLPKAGLTAYCSAAVSAKVVRPEEMNGLLQGLLARQAGLRLISLKTLAPQSIVAGTTGAKAPAKEAQDKPAERVFDLYRHGVEIRLEGSYDDLQVYMAQLEKLPQRLLWGELVYRVIDYPRAEIRLTLYSLSPDKAWLAL